MKLPLIDSHAHLTSDSVYSDLDEILTRAEESGLQAIVNICTDQTTLERGVKLSKKYPWIYNTAATTPHDVATNGESFFPIVEQAARRGDLVALGETGLDYYYEHAPRELQKQFTQRYFELALELNLPVVIHCREAFDDLFSLIDTHFSKGRGILHCFTGNLSEAKEVIARGWMLSLSGIATFKKSEELKKVAAWVPLEQLLIETDTPYLAPQGHRGKPNEPSFLTATCRILAGIKGISPEELASQTAKNTNYIFNLK